MQPCRKDTVDRQLRWFVVVQDGDPALTAGDGRVRGRVREVDDEVFVRLELRVAVNQHGDLLRGRIAGFECEVTAGALVVVVGSRRRAVGGRPVNGHRLAARGREGDLERERSRTRVPLRKRDVVDRDARQALLDRHRAGRSRCTTPIVVNSDRNHIISRRCIGVVPSHTEPAGARRSDEASGEARAIAPVDRDPEVSHRRARICVTERCDDDVTGVDAGGSTEGSEGGGQGCIFVEDGTEVMVRRFFFRWLGHSNVHEVRITRPVRREGVRGYPVIDFRFSLGYLKGTGFFV